MKLRIAEVRAEKNMTQQQVADAIGMHLTNYSNLENNKLKRGVSLNRLSQIADVLHSTPEELIARVPRRRVQVRGYVQAGHYAESSEWPEEDRYEVALGTTDPARDHFPLFAVETRGPSMDRVYPEGTVLICIDLERLPEEPQSGKCYIVERIRSDGLREMTVKRLVKDTDGRIWLQPESTDPRFSEAIPLEADEGDQIRVVGRVAWSQRPE